MSKNKENLPENKKVFFITSNYSRESQIFEYTLKINKAMNNLLVPDGYTKSLVHHNDKYLVSVCSFEINPSELKDEHKDEETKKYKAVITLKNTKTDYSFKGYALFRLKNKNNFIYDFKFEDHFSTWMKKRTFAPASIKFSKSEQFKIFKDFLNSKKVSAEDDINIDLIQNSQYLTLNREYEMDFFMEIFKRCAYQQNIVILFLNLFDLNKASLPDNFKYDLYKTFLGLIERKTKSNEYLKTAKNKSKLYLNVYTIIFYLRSHFDKENAAKMILDKDLYIYFADFLPRYANKFVNLTCPEELIEKMFEGKLSWDIIKGILGFAGNVEKILFFINKNAGCVKSCVIQEKKVYIMSELGNGQETDNLNKIYEEICKFIDYELNEKILIVSFDVEFWNLYISLFNDLNSLDLINKAKNKCSKVEKNLLSADLGLKDKFHKIGLELIEKGELINEKLLDFINLDFYFSEMNKDSRNYNKKRPYLTILKGIILEKMTDAFYEKWEKTNLFKIFNFDIGNFKTALIEKMTDIKDLGKLLKLFDYKNQRIFDFTSRKSLEDQFIKIVDSFKHDTCPNFIEDVSYYIYIMDYVDKKNIQNFMQKTIQENIKFLDIIRDIYLFIATNYKDISNYAIDHITNFLTSKTYKLDTESLLFFLEKIDNVNIVKSLLNKIDYLIIKEEELFSTERNFSSFKLLEGIIQKDLMNKWEEIKNTKYFLKTYKIKQTILDKIINEEINYTSYMKVWNVLSDLREIFKHKLQILLFNNEEEFNSCRDKLNELFPVTMKLKSDLDNLINIFNGFYKKKYKNELSETEDLKKQLQTGYISHQNIKDITNKAENLKKIFKKLAEDEEIKKKFDNFPDFSGHIDLKKSIFFTHLFKTTQAKNIIKSDLEIIIAALQDFVLLKHFFEPDWITQIPDSIIKECYKALKENATEEKKEKNNLTLIGKELRILSRYFKIKNFNENKYLTLEDHLKIYSQKEDIFLTANSCIHFISILKATKTECFEELIKIRGEMKKNIILEAIKTFGESLKKYGLKIIDSTNEDRDYLDILLFLNEKENALKFLAEHKSEDFRTLREQMIESEQTLLTNNDIQDTIKCNEFIQNLIKEGQTDKELIENFVNLVPKKKGITAAFKNYSSNSNQIIDLFDEKFDKKKQQ